MLGGLPAQAQSLRGLRGQDSGAWDSLGSLTKVMHRCRLLRRPRPVLPSASAGPLHCAFQRDAHVASDAPGGWVRKADWCSDLSAVAILMVTQSSIRGPLVRILAVEVA